MSSSAQARRTAVQVSFGGVDISKDIRPYLLSLTYTDNEADEADDLQIKLQDRDGVWLTKWLNPALQAAAGQSGTALGETAYRVTPAVGLNVRAGPGTQYQKLSALPYSAVVTVLELSGSWAKITWSDRDAWVCADYLEAVGAIAAAGSGEICVGDEVDFTGTRHYVSSTGNQGYAAKPGPARVTLQNPGSLHPWHLIHTDGTSNVYGWVDEKDVQPRGGTQAAESSGAVEVTQTGFAVTAAILRENWRGDGKDDLLECGSFELDSIKASGSPNVVTIKATGLPYAAQVRQTQKSRAWEAYHLSGIAQQMANENGMALLYSTEKDPEYERMEQYRESDIAFLSRLCKDAGVSLKASSNMLVLFDKASSGQQAALTVRRGDNSYLSYDLSTGAADTKYASCRVRYADPATGRVIEGVAYAENYKEDAKNNQQLEVSAKVTSIAEAQALAAARLKLHNQFSRTATFTFPGNPAILAGATVVLEDFGMWDGAYIIQQAQHSVGSSGYTTRASLRRAMEG